MLLNNGTNLNMKHLGKNPLHIFFKFFAADKVDSSLLDLLISYNCDVNEKDNDGCSPLFLCFENCNEKYDYDVPQPWEDRILSKLFYNRKNLEILLKNKANINEVFANGQSILHLFISSDICQKCWIDVGGCSAFERNTVGIELIKTLLKYGANVNAKDDSGDSPLHLTVMSNNLNVVELLLAHGADMQSFDFSKLHWSTSHLDFDWLHQMIRFF
ncbi:hypothetical protein TKK_0007107 [Trichogramma kaykai]|uniref:Uncharacterized protein n=1 Tax=Trichogramma kaykai TaxID=54128 RepID=A0ABD2X9B8_9HYME